MPGDVPIKADRDEPGVFHAFAVGAVACEHCKGVHIDFVDETSSVRATGFLTFDAWLSLVLDVEHGIEDMVKQGVAGS